MDNILPFKPRKTNAEIHPMLLALRPEVEECIAAFGKSRLAEAGEFAVDVMALVAEADFDPGLVKQVADITKKIKVAQELARSIPVGGSTVSPAGATVTRDDVYALLDALIEERDPLFEQVDSGDHVELMLAALGHTHIAREGMR